MRLALNISQLRHIKQHCLGAVSKQHCFFGAGRHSVAHMAQHFHPRLRHSASTQKGNTGYVQAFCAVFWDTQVKAARAPAMLVEPPAHQKHLEPSSLQQSVPEQEQNTAYTQLDKVPALGHQPREVPLHWP